MEIFYPITLGIGSVLLFLWSFLLALSPVGLVRIFPILIGAFALVRMDSKAEWKRFAVGLALFIAYVADVLAWWYSKEAIGPERSTRLWGTWPSAFVAGFPMHTMELPPPPMGPGDEWTNMLTVAPNLLFWLACAAVATYFAYRLCSSLPSPKNWRPGRIGPLLVIGAFLFNGLFFATYMLWFD